MHDVIFLSVVTVSWMPIDIVRCFHNAFRRDSREIDSAVYEVARDGGDLTPILNRFHVLNEVLDYHARGEEAAVFPAVDSLRPLVAKAYLIDHRELDAMCAGLEAMRASPDVLDAARATAALNAHLRIHLDKEDVHLYPIIRENVSETDQAAIGRVMSSKVPPDKLPLFLGWLIPLLDLTDQVNVTRGWMKLMPPQVFSNLKPAIQRLTGPNWPKITEQIPEL